MRLVFVVCGTLTLAACGADGEPFYPTTTNVVTLSNNGVSASTNIAATRGPLTIGVGGGL